MKYIYLLIVTLFLSCQKEIPPVTPPSNPIVFTDDIQNSTWILKDIEFQNQTSVYNDTLIFLSDSILIYNKDTSNYEFYQTANNMYQLRLQQSPVGYIDTDLTSGDLIRGSLFKQVFYNVYILSNRYKITLQRLK